MLDSWNSKSSGAVYPARWRIKIPLLGIDLNVTLNLPDQEMSTEESTGVTYWEGSVSAKGTKGGSPIEGQGWSYRICRSFFSAQVKILCDLLSKFNISPRHFFRT